MSGPEPRAVSVHLPSRSSPLLSALGLTSPAVHRPPPQNCTDISSCSCKSQAKDSFSLPKFIHRYKVPHFTSLLNIIYSPPSGERMYHPTHCHVTCQASNGTRVPPALDVGFGRGISFGPGDEDEHSVGHVRCELSQVSPFPTSLLPFSSVLRPPMSLWTLCHW